MCMKSSDVRICPQLELSILGHTESTTTSETHLQTLNDLMSKSAQNDKLSNLRPCAELDQRWDVLPIQWNYLCPHPVTKNTSCPSSDHMVNTIIAEPYLIFCEQSPKLRRNIAILGLLHKRVIGKCHPAFEQLLPWYSQRSPEGRGFGHSKQLYNHCVEISAP